MSEETGNQILSIEDAVARSMPLCLVRGSGGGLFPLDTSERIKFAQRKTKERPGYFSLAYLGAWNTEQLERKKDLTGEEHGLGRICAAKVDLDEYLTAFKQLLNHPEKIQDYVELLDPEVKKLVMKSTETSNGYFGDSAYTQNHALIHQLFGMHNCPMIGVTVQPDKKDEFFQFLDDKLWLSFNISRKEDYGYSGLFWKKTLKIYPRVSIGSFFKGYNTNSSALEFAGEFSIPSGNTEADNLCFQGLNEIVDVLKSYDGLSEICFNTAPNTALYPIFKK